MYQGIESEYIYVLKDGVAKISNILRDGREFNIAYVAQPDFVSLLEENKMMESQHYLMSEWNLQRLIFIKFRGAIFGIGCAKI